MKFGTFYSHSLKATVKQINKTTAKKLYNEGKNIFVHPCNMLFDNMWGAENFDSRISDYAYYNCDNERGKYPCFFTIENK